MDNFYIFLIGALFALCSGEVRRVLRVKEIGLNVKVNCTLLPRANGSEIKYWLLNDGSRALPGAGEHATFSISHDGEILEFKELKFFHLGTYACVVGNDTAILARHQIDISLYTGSLWETYKTNLMVACISAALCAFICIFACLVYHYRWRPPKLTTTETIVSNEDYSINGAGAAAAASNTPKHSSGFSNNSVAPQDVMDTKL